MASIVSGLDSGPLALFNEDGATVIITPHSEFMAASAFYDLQRGQVSWGIIGTMSSIPKGYKYSTIMVSGKNGVRKVIVSYQIQTQITTKKINNVNILK